MSNDATELAYNLAHRLMVLADENPEIAGAARALKAAAIDLDVPGAVDLPVPGVGLTKPSLQFKRQLQEARDAVDLALALVSALWTRSGWPEANRAAIALHYAQAVIGPADRLAFGRPASTPPAHQQWPSTSPQPPGPQRSPHPPPPLILDAAPLPARSPADTGSLVDRQGACPGTGLAAEEYQGLTSTICPYCVHRVRVRQDGSIGRHHKRRRKQQL